MHKRETLGSMGRRDADRELYRVKQVSKRQKAAQHDKPRVWGFQPISSRPDRGETDARN